MTLISSVRLGNISVLSNRIDFSRDGNIPEDIEIEFRLKSAFSESVDEELESDEMSDITESSCRIIFTAEVIGKHNEDKIFSIELSVAYIFSVSDKKTFQSVSEKYRSEICGNLTYLDFRRRLMLGVSSIGVSSFGLPLSLSELQEEPGE